MPSGGISDRLAAWLLVDAYYRGELDEMGTPNGWGSVLGGLLSDQELWTLESQIWPKAMDESDE